MRIVVTLEYSRRTERTDVDPITSYRWANDVGLVVFDGAGTVELAVRSAMAYQFATHGLRLYEDAGLLDDDTLKPRLEILKYGPLPPYRRSSRRS